MSIYISLPPDTMRKLREVSGDLEAIQRVIVEESASFAPSVKDAMEHEPVTADVIKVETALNSPRRADGLTDEEFEELYEKLTAIMKDRSVPYTGTYTRDELYDDHL